MSAKQQIAIGYLRISDPKQLTGSSLEDQEKAIRAHVKSKGWELYKDQVFNDIFTGITSLRPTYQFLLEEIRENKGRIDFFVIKVLDRISREGAAEYFSMKDELSALGVELRDTQDIIQPAINTLSHTGVGFEWSMVSSSRMTETILAEMGRQERVNILTRTVSGSLERIETGYHVRAPNDGYVNVEVVDANGKVRYINAPDPERAKFIEMIFEMSDKGVFSDKEIVEKINACGYKTKIKKKWNKKRDTVIGSIGGTPMTVKGMQALRKNPIYCGVKIENWGNTISKKMVVKTINSGLVTVELFNRVNKGKVFVQELENNLVQVLYNQQPEKSVQKRNKFRTDFIFKNIILCPYCRKPLKASGSTNGKTSKKYPAYHCGRKHKQFSVSKKELHFNVMTYLNQIKFQKKYISIFEKVLVHKFREEQKGNSQAQVSVNQKIIDLHTQLQNILGAIKVTKSERMREDLEKEYDGLCIELDETRVERGKLEITELELDSFVTCAKNLVEHPTNMLANIENKAEQLALFHLFFDEFPTYTEIVSGTPKLSLIFAITKPQHDAEALLVSLC